MRIDEIRIHNYRSIRNLACRVEPLMVLLGPNNHGKSNILRAIEFHLTPSAKPTRWDLYAHRDDGDDELWVELSFTDLTDQERNTFRKYVCSDERLTVRKSARVSASGSDTSYAAYVEEPDEWWLGDDAHERLKTKELVGREAEAVPQLQPLVERSGRITKDAITEFQQNHITEHRDELNFTRRLEGGPFMGQKNVAAGLLPDFHLVPAIRDLGDETRVASTTTFGRLVKRTVAEMRSTGTRLNDLQGQINRAVAELEVSADGEEGASALERAIAEELRWWNVDVHLRIEPPAVQNLVEESVRLDLDDGLRTPAEEKGHGLQRATIFALLRAWAKTLRGGQPREQEELTPRKASESAIFAIEEPELFLHPQAQRQLAQALEGIAGSPDHQVFVCTHSPHFVSLDRYRSLAVVTKPTLAIGTTVCQCTDELFGGEGGPDRKRRFQMAAWVNPDRGEMFFAKKVILVEGATEKAAFPYLADRLGCLDPDVSVIDCGSKFNLCLYIKICEAFRIPYVVVYDEDPVPNPALQNWTKDRLKEAQHAFSENDKIKQSVDPALGEAIMIPGDFGTALGVSRSAEKNKGKPLATLDHLESMSPEDTPETIRDAVVRAYRVEGQGPR
jgi:CRISPR-associated exonuclease Cas4